MRISMKSDYALRAMMELARAYGRPPIQTSEIAARRAIPESYLEQLLTTLRKAGFVVSTRGPQGGHTLAAPPARISAGDVVRAMEGPIVVMDCLAPSDPCQVSPTCAVHGLWHDVRSAIEAVLNGVTIADLLEQEATRSSAPMYNI